MTKPSLSKWSNQFHPNEF